jgi:hypothetical protein
MDDGFANVAKLKIRTNGCFVKKGCGTHPANDARVEPGRRWLAAADPTSALSGSPARRSGASAQGREQTSEKVLKLPHSTLSCHAELGKAGPKRVPGIGQ